MSKGISIERDPPVSLGDVGVSSAHQEEVLERDVGLAVPSDSLERLCTRWGFSGVSAFSVTRAAIRDRHSSCGDGGRSHQAWEHRPNCTG